MFEFPVFVFAQVLHSGGFCAERLCETEAVSVCSIRVLLCVCLFYSSTTVCLSVLFEYYCVPVYMYIHATTLVLEYVCLSVCQS